MIVPILCCDLEPRETMQEWEEFLQFRCKRGHQNWMEDKLRLFRVWKSRSSSLRNNGAEIFRTASAEISDKFYITQSQRLLLCLLSLLWMVPYSEEAVPQMFKHLFQNQGHGTSWKGYPDTLWFSASIHLPQNVALPLTVSRQDWFRWAETVQFWLLDLQLVVLSASFKSLIAQSSLMSLRSLGRFTCCAETLTPWNSTCKSKVWYLH